MSEGKDETRLRFSASAGLDCMVAPVADLTTTEREELFALMSGHFDCIGREQFFRDLDEKHSIVLLREAAGAARIRGFSTMMPLEVDVAGRRVGAIFAGDTVIDPEYWGNSAWVYAWARHGFALAQAGAYDVVYLLLLTSTHRTYRFMPGFFHEYYPRPDRAIPAEVQARLDVLVRRKFPGEYDAARGVVTLAEPTPVRAERLVPGAAPGADEHDQFFLSRNPGYERGDFLVCLAEFSWENLTSLGRRVVSTAT